MKKKNIEIHCEKINSTIILVFLLLIATALQAKITSSQAKSAFSEMKIYDANGHPYRTVKENWDNARKLISEDSKWKSWL